MIKLYSILFLFLFIHTTGIAQTRIVLNGGMISMANNAYLVVANPAANAITRNSGYIISEAENNQVKWMLANTTGTYTVPFGDRSAHYLPVTFTKAAGTGSGYFLFSTFHTTWKNSLNLPSGVTSFAGSAGDNSAYVLDRFWQVNAQSYTGKPALTTVVFNYYDAEQSVASNTIIESNLKAQRWNDNLLGWGDYAPTGTDDATNNKVTVTSISAANLFKWWVLVDQNSALPVDFISFKAAKAAHGVALNWTVSHESGGQFEIQRSVDGILFNSIGVKQSGSGAGVAEYNYLDTAALTGAQYYRIRETDHNGQVTYSVIRVVYTLLLSKIAVYPNPSSLSYVYIDMGAMPLGSYAITLHDLHGRLIHSEYKNIGQSKLRIELPNLPRPGLYVLKLIGKNTFTEQKLLLN